MAGPPTLPRPGDVIAGKYQVDHELGTGGMGAVYQVTHRVTGKRFALKWLLPQISEREDAAQRFIREAQVAGRFEHPNVVEVYDVGAEGGSYFMVMELLQGESLAARVEREGGMTIADVCRLLIPCMHGVAEAHAAGIVHRDLKPGNIFICGATRTTPEFAKVLDFGISKVSGTAEEVTSMTKSGALIGTPHYMPLEQMRGRPVDHRADIYAFGVVLYQVLSGRLPYPATSFSDLVLMVAHETPPPLDEVRPMLPPGLAEVIGRAMARDPEDRYPSLAAFIAELERFDEAVVGPLPTGGRRRPSGSGSLRLPTPLSTESQSGRRSRSSTVPWVVAIAVLLVAIAGGALWFGGELRAPAADPPPTAATPRPPAETPASGPQESERLAPQVPQPRAAAQPEPLEVPPLAASQELMPVEIRAVLPATDADERGAARSDEPAESPGPAAEAERDDVRTSVKRGGARRSPTSPPSAALEPPAPARAEPPQVAPAEPQQAEPDDLPLPTRVTPPRRGRVPPISEEDFY